MRPGVRWGAETTWPRLLGSEGWFILSRPARRRSQNLPPDGHTSPQKGRRSQNLPPDGHTSPQKGCRLGDPEAWWVIPHLPVRGRKPSAARPVLLWGSDCILPASPWGSPWGSPPSFSPLSAPCPGCGCPGWGSLVWTFQWPQAGPRLPGCQWALSWRGPRFQPVRPRRWEVRACLEAGQAGVQDSLWARVGQEVVTCRVSKLPGRLCGWPGAPEGVGAAGALCRVPAALGLGWGLARPRAEPPFWG